LAGTRLAEQHERFLRLRGERNATKDFAFGEANAHVAELNDRLAGPFEREGKAAGRFHHGEDQKTLSARKSAIFVRNVSAIMMSTEETTTACVVARPTPCVPPRTFSP